ncbi:Oxysterol-binding protein-domain-containing protein [Lentinula aff. detonsa]|nr:Oxysterol-binding protein-domain-containing protein [Lentinula aff. detonsa]
MNDPPLPQTKSQSQSHSQASPSSSSLSSPPPLSGYLLKYTNLAKGYNPRWLVLRGGVLSYYRREEDESVASRGAISMRSAGVRVSPSDKLRFEIFSGSSSNSGPSNSPSAQKWYLKANHPIEANRWINAIEEWKDWCRQHQPGQSAQEGQQIGKPSLEASEGLRPSISSTNRFIGGLQSTIRRKTRKTHTNVKSNSATGSWSDGESFRHSGSIHGIQSEAESGISGISGLARAEKEKTESRFGHTDVSDAEDDEHEGEEADQKKYYNSDDNGDNDEGTEADLSLPYANTYEQHAQSILNQIESMKNLDAPSLSSSVSILEALISRYISMSNTREIHLQSCLSNAGSSLSQTRKSLSSTRKTLSSTRQSLRESETKRKTLEGTLKQARRAQKAWEESMKVVLEEEQGLEKELKRTSRNFGSLKSSRRESRRFGSPARQRSPISGAFDSTVKARMMAVARADEEEDGLKTPTVFERFDVVPDVVTQRIETTSLSTSLDDNDEDAESKDEDDEDEFFDAIESNNIPNLVVPAQLQASNTSLSTNTNITTNAKPISPPSSFTPSSSITSVYFTPTSSHTSSTVSVPTLSAISSLHAQYAPYANLRASLSLSTSRPAASLWSALKNSIGKDLTKISFPVYFNEPTSMLQRMAEDMEFSECLDIASNTPSPHLRIAYIAAFAMSNYSSTIGRIAKPFNPMLGETFEYVHLGDEADELEAGGFGKGERIGRRDQPGKQGYRYVSEQVSHHPPISACWAESFGMIEGEEDKTKSQKTGWRYFGEVDAQNKFMGKSFEIRPTGVAHVELRIPRAWVAGGRTGDGEDEDANAEMIVEHYTWKKVTTNVSGFILGSPTIDHYGDMTITNQLTSLQCILTFKPRGWRGKDAYEIAGHVISSAGDPTYEIAGKWDSQLVMRPVGNVHSHQTQEYILLWRNTSKPPGTPFNLTPFAITLNDLPSTLPGERERVRNLNVHTLKHSLPPTDSRLRPDQRAFEMGHWDLANVLKGKQEEKQRERRRRREKEIEASLGNSETHHQPRWFRAETDGDTGERVWMPLRDDERLEYWVERERVWREMQEMRIDGKGNDKREEVIGKWKNVEDIFIDEPKELREDPDQYSI